MEQSFRTWVNTITREALIIGEGSPEDVIPAVQGREYMDSNGTTGSLIYRKRESDIGGDNKKGWVAV
tara:strand:+ start:218 stop:418 length:201 start_codon:yes stop_codon:yes gene_type:complete